MGESGAEPKRMERRLFSINESGILINQKNIFKP